MITFLRHIRKDLIRSEPNGEPASPLGRYLLYAIGEILLVMIGILLALQVNNWNENKKLRAEEINLLTELGENLAACIEELGSDIAFNKLTIEKYKELMTAVKLDLPYSPKLDSAFMMIHDWESPYLTFTAYEVLKSKGVELIHNDSLRMSVVNLYENVFAYLIDDYDRTEWNYHQSVVMPFSSRHMESNVHNYGARPNNFEALKKNVEFTNILSNLISARNWGLEVYQFTYDEVADVQKQIQQELNN